MSMEKLTALGAGMNLSLDPDPEINHAGAVTPPTRPQNNAQVVPGASPFARDFKQEFLGDDITAYLILYGCYAIFAGNYWIIKDRKNHATESERAGRIHIHVGASLDDWRRAVAKLTGAPLK